MQSYQVFELGGGGSLEIPKYPNEVPSKNEVGELGEEKGITILEEELERLHIYQSRHEQAAAIEQPSFIRRIFRFILPL